MSTKLKVKICVDITKSENPKTNFASTGPKLKKAGVADTTTTPAYGDDLR